MTKYNAISGIYVIVHMKSGKVYIGQAQSIGKRWNDHRSNLNRGVHGNRHLQSAWNKYGAKAFKFKVLEYCLVDRLDEREQHFIDIHIPRGMCYNIATDAKYPMRGRKASEETRKKISDSGKGNKNSLGIVPSEETKQKISNALKGRSPANKGKTASEETRRKMSEARKGNKNSLGVVHNAETRRKMSEARKGNKNSLGHKHSEETKRKMSEAHKQQDKQG